MELIEVKDRQQERDWLRLPVQMYCDDPNYIRPIDKEVEEVFDRDANRLFATEGSECIRWLLRDNGQYIGRIAAFVNGKTARTGDFPVGGCGFFDCTNSHEAANVLFSAARDWLKARGMEAMDGPVNFGERDKFWGVLVDGFDQQNYGMNYNAPYYKELFEGFGFKLYFNQYTFGRSSDRKNDLSPRFYERANEALGNPDIEFRYIPKKELHKAAGYFHEVYTKAWGGHKGVKPMTMEQAEKMFKRLKPIVDPRLIWFAFHQGRPIAMYISIPELNQLFKHVDGKMNLWGKLKFLYHQWKGDNTKMLGIVFGVVPEWQGKGVESAIVVAFSRLIWGKGLPYTQVEMNWIGDFNPKMMRVCEQLGASIIRTHATYRLLFDPERPFERCPIIE